METQRLLIRRFTPDDWKDLYEYLSQASTIKYEPYDVFTEEDSKQEAAKRSSDKNFWAVCLKDSGKLIGNIYLAPQELDTWELGYVFNADYQGRGYATEAAFATVDYVFTNHNARRVIAMCNPQNESSWKLPERLGMRREGRLRQNIYFKKDANDCPIWQDTFEYGILATEWANCTAGTSLSRFRLIVLWLKTVSILFAVFGIIIALFNQTAVFQLAFSNNINPVFWAHTNPSAEAVYFQRWVYGLLGAVCLMIGILIFFIVKYPFEKREKWAWYGLFIGVAGWFVIDTPISLYFKVHFNAAFNVILLLSMIIPLFLSKKEFKNQLP